MQPSLHIRPYQQVKFSVDNFPTNIIKISPERFFSINEFKN